MTFLVIWFILSVFVFGFLIYRKLKGKPIKQELIETKAKLEVEEVINAEIKRELPSTRSGRVALLNKLRKSRNK